MSSKSQKQKKRNKIIALTLVVSSMTALLSVIASML